MEITDEVHWSYFYGLDGTLKIQAMDRKRSGKWSIQKG
jgi:hypothetical protein